MDYVFLITLTSTRSATFDNAHKASFTVLQSYHQIRGAVHELAAAPGDPVARCLRPLELTGEMRHHVLRDQLEAAPGCRRAR